MSETHRQWLVLKPLAFMTFTFYHFTVSLTFLPPSFPTCITYSKTSLCSRVKISYPSFYATHFEIFVNFEKPSALLLFAGLETCTLFLKLFPVSHFIFLVLGYFVRFALNSRFSFRLTVCISGLSLPVELVLSCIMVLRN